MKRAGLVQNMSFDASFLCVVSPLFQRILYKHNSHMIWKNVIMKGAGVIQNRPFLSFIPVCCFSPFSEATLYSHDVEKCNYEKSRGCPK